MSRKVEEIVAEIFRVFPISSAAGDGIRDRVRPILDSIDAVDIHRLLTAQAVALAIEIGTKHSDIEASYEAMLTLIADVLATLQAINRRLHKKPVEDAPAALALVAFAAADRVNRDRGDQMERFIREFHSWAIEERI